MRMGDRIRRERQRLGLSQREFADRAGITFQMASLYENDHRTPRIETLTRIADTLHVPAWWLVWDGEPDDDVAPLSQRPELQPLVALLTDDEKAVLDAGWARAVQLARWRTTRNGGGLPRELFGNDTDRHEET